MLYSQCSLQIVKVALARAGEPEPGAFGSLEPEPLPYPWPSFSHSCALFKLLLTEKENIEKIQMQVQKRSIYQ